MFSIQLSRILIVTKTDTYLKVNTGYPCQISSDKKEKLREGHKLENNTDVLHLEFQKNDIQVCRITPQMNLSHIMAAVQ